MHVITFVKRWCLILKAYTQILFDNSKCYYYTCTVRHSCCMLASMLVHNKIFGLGRGAIISKNLYKIIESLKFREDYKIVTKDCNLVKTVAREVM